MADVAQLLQTLHPMREPPPPVPVLPFLLTIGVGLVLATLGFAALVALRRRRLGLRRAARLALAATRDLPPAERFAAQAGLLRRLVRVRAGVAAAREQGDGWLLTLDRVFATTFFTAGDGRAFADALYRRGGTPDVEAVDRSLTGLFARIGGDRAQTEVGA